MKGRILVIDDEENILSAFKGILVSKGHEVATARNYNEAMTMLSERKFDLIFTDIILEDIPGKDDKTGIDILREVKKRNLNSPVALITKAPNIDTAIDSLRLGAFDYVPKPVREDVLLYVTNKSLQYKSLLDERERYRSNLEAIFRSVKDAIITVDDKLTVIETNEATENICGITRDAVGKILISLSRDCSGKCLDAVRETIDKKNPVEAYHIECRHKNRPTQIVNLTTYPLINSMGVFSGAVLVVKDETRLAVLENALKERRQFHNIIGISDGMQKIYSLIESLCDVQTTVLITGESGTGKEMIAEALHYTGVRGSKPIVKVNCSALSEELLESELFGHVKGAFTGAVKDRSGRFQMADGGTIFLDEIGDISPKIQLKLLRVLQEFEFERVGDSNPIKVDVRLIAATNQDLKEKVKLGKFREDLYYRLKVVEINLPSLRERRVDIPLMTKHFIDKFNKKIKKNITGISADVEKLFMEYHWHGNIRELEHTIEHAFILCRQNTIAVEHLPIELREFKSTPSSTTQRGKKLSDEDEYQAILQALEKTGWNKAKAARLLGMSRQTMYRKIEEHKINPPSP
ncbi:MAG: sigma-54-dependent Fis family transcriptional regulator [Nitrospinae bacterium]|nr:sigma-54-dependent Fis family transcriptional regulator [Nitrospinota bacterium]